jgi:hypothetical protein
MEVSYAKMVMSYDVMIFYQLKPTSYIQPAPFTHLFFLNQLYLSGDLMVMQQ